MKKLYLIRHAQSTSNAETPHLLGGQDNNISLSERGKLQAQALGRRLQNYEPGYVICSSAARTQETLEQAIRARAPLKLGHLDDRLLELSRGDAMYMHIDEYFTEETRKYHELFPLDAKAPNGESYREVANRITSAIQEMLEEHDCVYAITHGNAIKSYLQRDLRFAPEHTWKLAINNTSISEIHYDERGTHLQRINDIAHLRQ